MLGFLKSKGKLVLSLGVVILVIALAILGYVFLRIDKSLIKDLVVVKRTVYAQEKSTGGLLAMNFNRDNEKYQYVNAAIDFNKDGKFSSYQADGQTQEEWVVENMEPKIKKDEGLGLAIPLVDLSLDNQKDFPVKVVFSKEKLANWQGERKFGSATLSSTIKSIEKNDLSEIYQPDPEKIRSGGFSGNFFASSASASENDPPPRPTNINEEQDALIEAGQSDEGSTSDQSQSSGEGSQNQSPDKEKTVQSLAKEFDNSHSNMPDLDQKKNECAPTATANSLLWLAAKGEYLDKLPQTAPELIDKLKTNFKWTAHGVDVKNNYMEGKATTISQLGLPLETHAVGKPFDLNIVAKIAQEIAKGQDVEIDLAYYKMNPDGTGERIGGHMVTVVGARGTKDAQYLDIHDPSTTGENKTDSYKINGSNVIGYTSGTTQTFIRYAIAESPITPPTITPSTSSTPINPTSTATINSNPNATNTITSKVNASTSPSIITSSSSSPTSTNTSDGQQTSSPTSSSTSASPTTSSAPTFTSHYETYIGNADNGYVNDINIKITPTQLGGKSFNGVKVDFGGQGLPTPYSSNTNINLAGWGATADWNCSLGTTVTCQGTTIFTLNTKSIFAFFFTESLAGAPNNLTVQLLENSVTAATLSVPLQNP